MRPAFPALLALLASLGLLAGCPSEEPLIDDLTFDPEVDERGAGSIDFGNVAVGTNPPPSARIVATNNSDAVISLGVDCDDLAGTPFNISCPADRVDIPPAGSEDPNGAANNFAAVGGTLLAGAGNVGDVAATIFFDWDNRIWTFAITATITN